MVIGGVIGSVIAMAAASIPSPSPELAAHSPRDVGGPYQDTPPTAPPLHSLDTVPFEKPISLNSAFTT